MLQLRDIPIDENSQGEKSLNLMSYLKKSLSISLKKCLSLKKKILEKSLSLGFEKFGLEKVSISVSKEVSVSVSKTFGLKKVSVSLSKTFGLAKKVSVSVSKTFGLEKSLGISFENIWS